VVLGSITTYIVDRQFMKAAGFACAGGVLTFFGLMHGEAIGLNKTPTVAIAYIVVGVFLGLCAKLATVTAPAPEHEEAEEGHMLPTPAVE
jgi:AGZA family xanthine/uracil permease-like MFS transporter